MFVGSCQSKAVPRGSPAALSKVEYATATRLRGACAHPANAAAANTPMLLDTNDRNIVIRSPKLGIREHRTRQLSRQITDSPLEDRVDERRQRRALRQNEQSADEHKQDNYGKEPEFFSLLHERPQLTHQSHAVPLELSFHATPGCIRVDLFSIDPECFRRLRRTQCVLGDCAPK